MKIEIKNLSVSFGEKKVIENFSFSLSQSKTVAIFGRSGSGKTTLLRVIAKLIKDYTGSVFIDGKISYMFQEDRLLAGFTVLENVFSVVKRQTGEKREQAEHILSRLALSEYKNQSVNDLSGGQKRRVALARTLIADSEIILLDEPFNGLDAEVKGDAIELIRQYKKDHIIILVSHDEGDIKALSDLTISL